jgi:transposase
MIDAEKRRSVFLLHQSGMAKREIARRLELDPKTVREIIKAGGAVPKTKRSDRIEIPEDELRELHHECGGWIQRVHERLMEEGKYAVSYPTLTRMLRRMGISNPPKTRCDRVEDVPGAEMQHDTSPFRITVGEVRSTVVASLLYLRYSKRRYLKFYRHFRRFDMKCFFHEALTYWGYAAPECIIDNTNLARLSGAGASARIHPEMEAFAKQYGFVFRCHAINHPNRKAGEERGFYTVESNFLPGRSFESLEDLNGQALEWATEWIYHRPLTAAKIVPSEYFEREKPLLVRVPSGLPAPYLSMTRLINQYGEIHVDANFYWIPGEGRGEVKVLVYADRIEVYRGREHLCGYERPPQGVRGEHFPAGHKRKPGRKPHRRKRPTEQEEKRLRSLDPVVGAFLDAVLAPQGLARHNTIRKLFRLSSQMSAELFVKSLRRAHTYGVRDLETIERIAHIYLHQGEADFSGISLDDSYRERDSYQEGALTDPPDLSIYSPDEEDAPDERDDAASA